MVEYRSSCEDLWKRHLDSSSEITADPYAKMAERHGGLWRCYKQMLRSHTVLKDDLEHLTRQLSSSLNVCTSKLFAVITELTIVVA